MNNIEKVKYILELKELTRSLEFGSLTLFETAQAKKRIQDIFALFDEPIFQKYLPQNAIKNEVKIIHPTPTQRGIHNYTLASQKFNKPEPKPQIEDSKPLTTDKALLKDDVILEDSAKEEETEVNNSEALQPENLQHETPILSDIPPIQTATPKLENVNIDGTNYSAKPVLLKDNETSLYEFSISELPNHIVLINEANIESLMHRPIFIAEEISNTGSFTQYIMYMGAENEIEAIESLKAYSQNLSCEISAIRQLIWQNLKDALNSNDTLFKAYISSNTIIWQQSQYFPFIPKNLVSNRKFIFFEEDEAQTSTPLLFLEERGKIRLICGKNRLLLNEQEVAFPYTTFTRQQGLNWQKIQEIIASLNQPIATLDLLNALNKHIKNS